MKIFQNAKTINLLVAAVLVALLVAYFVFNRREGGSEHDLSNVQAANFESTVLKADKPVLVDFYADWCGPCRRMEPILVEFAKENPQVKVVQVNVDENAEVAVRFNVQNIPNFVVFKNGEKTAQQVGMMSKEELKALVNE